jgi:hypothetical protein
MVPDLPFVWSQKAFAAIAGFDPALFPAGHDEFHQRFVLLRSKLQSRVRSTAAHGKNGKDAPGLDPCGQEVFLDLI